MNEKTNNFEEAENVLAYMIWIVEKEFNVGLIDGSFPLMKLWHLSDEGHISQYNESMQGDGGSSNSKRLTFRGM